MTAILRFCVYITDGHECREQFEVARADNRRDKCATHQAQARRDSQRKYDEKRGRKPFTEAELEAARARGNGRKPTEPKVPYSVRRAAIVAKFGNGYRDVSTGVCLSTDSSGRHAHRF